MSQGIMGKRLQDNLLNWEKTEVINLKQNNKRKQGNSLQHIGTSISSVCMHH